MQHALETLTGLRPGEQILMLDGHPLDKAQPLSHYGLPSVSAFLGSGGSYLCVHVLGHTRPLAVLNTQS